MVKNGSISNQYRPAAMAGGCDAVFVMSVAALVTR
jgi:hypothetical protein